MGRRLRPRPRRHRHPPDAAERAASQYAEPQPVAPPSPEQDATRLAALIDRLHRTTAREQLAYLEPALRDAKAAAEDQRIVAPLKDASVAAWRELQNAEQQATIARQVSMSSSGSSSARCASSGRPNGPPLTSPRPRSRPDRPVRTAQRPGRNRPHRTRCLGRTLDRGGATTGRRRQGGPPASREPFWDQGDAQSANTLPSTRRHSPTPSIPTPHRPGRSRTRPRPVPPASEAWHDAVAAGVRIAGGWARASAYEPPQLTKETEHAAGRYNAADRHIRSIISDPLIADRRDAARLVTGLVTGWQGERDAEQAAQAAAEWQRHAELDQPHLPTPSTT